MEIKIKNILLTLLIATSCSKPMENANADKEDWEVLFNGKDLTGWDIKIAGYGLNDNYNNTFRVQDSAIFASYDEYSEFKNDFGHLYYNKPYSYYRLKLQYRFRGNQAKGGPNYAYLNSGVMVHSQSAQSLDKGQLFPVSLEMQFLASDKDSLLDRHTGNLCTPGTAVGLNMEPNHNHVIESTSRKYDAGEWVNAEVIVLGDSIVHHVVDGDTVLTYHQPFITDNFVSSSMNWTNSGFVDSLQWINKNGQLLGEGYIALQAESHPIEFKNIQLLTLKGCMDSKALNYKSYYIKPDNRVCVYK